jgi:hypothetical protein
VQAVARLRETAPTNEKLSRKVVQLENRVSDPDEIPIEIVREIRQLIETPRPKGKKKSIGFIRLETEKPDTKKS